MVNEMNPSGMPYRQTNPTSTYQQPPQNNTPQYSYPQSRTYLMLIIVGIIILMIGGIINISLGFLDAPERPDYDDYVYGSSDYQDAVEQYNKDTEGYQDAKRLIPTIGQMFEYIGLLLLSLGLIIGSIKDDSLPANARLGLLLAFGLIVGLKFISIIFSYVVSSPYG